MSNDAVYAERNRLVAALANLFANATWRALDPDAPDSTVVYIKLPTGQVSWHIPNAEMGPFPPLTLRDPSGWDGHDTDEKYRRLAALRVRAVSDAVRAVMMLDRNPSRVVEYDHEFGWRLYRDDILGTLRMSSMTEHPIHASDHEPRWIIATLNRGELDAEHVEFCDVCDAERW